MRIGAGFRVSGHASLGFRDWGLGFTGGVGFVIGLDAATRTTEAHARLATLTVVEMNN